MKYKKGDTVTGTVTGIEDYGIFLKLDNNYTGLVHISEISDSFVKNVNDYVKLGENISVKIIDINDDNKQLKLSIKALLNTNKLEESPNGFDSLKKELPVWINEKIKEYDK